MNLTVLMCAYNAEAYIQTALDSILQQQLRNAQLTVIVVDDGSTDQTEHIVSRIAAAHPEVTLLTSAHQGVTRARNAALSALPHDADFVTFLDSDDFIPPGRYAADISAFQNDPALSVVYGSTTLFRDTEPPQTVPPTHTEVATGRGIQLAAGMYRAELIRRVGLFDTRFSQAEDFDFLLRMFEQSPKYLVRDDVCLYYRRHAHNLTLHTADLRRGFAQALLFSVRRRKEHHLPPIPSELFDRGELADSHDW